MTFTPTSEQQLILDEAGGSSSLLISALAGAAKTSTLCLLAQKLPLVPTLCVAFNKRIAEEMQRRMPSHIQCATLNSLGHRVWGAKLGKRLTLNTDKGYTILSEIIDRMPRAEASAYREAFASILKAVRFAKSAGYVPPRSEEFGQGLCFLEDLKSILYQQIDCEIDSDFIRVMNQCLESSIAEAFTGRIDFDDQIYMSTLFGGRYPKFPIVMVDEAQDLSSLNHASLVQMVGGRLIAVGDPNQAIYAFRGAHHTSMGLLSELFQAKPLTLSTSFRCPQAVVRNVQDWVPHMRWPEWAAEGAVTRLAEWGPKDIPDGSAIICRNNAPIFQTAMRLIRAGRGVKILGNDIGAGLLKILDKLGPGDLTSKLGLGAIAAWEKKEEAKAHSARVAAIRDKAACLRVFVSETSSLDEAKAYAKAIFAASGPIQLMTGHKSKGGEWPIVFHLDSFLVPSKWALRAAEESGDESQLIQEKNLRYVINTRAQESLIYINSEDFQL